MGSTPRLRHPVQLLYANNQHWLRFAGGTFLSVNITSGVKQGCPLSPLLFVIATDAFVRALAAIAGQGSVTRGFADDIALGLEKLWAFGPSIAHLFDEYRVISGLALSPTKCVLIPLWPGNVANIKMLLREIIPMWVTFAVAGCGKYLGTWIGPLAGDMAWRAIHVPRYFPQPAE